MSVNARISQRTLPTYPLGEPERNPMFFEKRVYQGSSGKVYPIPFIDKVHDQPVAKDYQLVTLENEYVHLEMLPEIGGRIFKGQDKTNGNYDFFYRQDVIKPALVSLAGPWISGGVEFNWPQHHRPGTYLPTDVFIEEESDGSRTVWMSDIDPLQRMKGMHGVRLRPDSSLVELRVRLFNRTPLAQTFLWWANVAAKAHDRYQSFFPQDVHYVADHAVRAMSSFPIAQNEYYGIDYKKRTDANDLSWYRNIPVPTSYMVCETQGSFFGGYDYASNGGFVHVANRHISPGKKQWTWGNHEFGWAWDRELTDNGGPYVELMAGVFTDNQPDFSYLLPYETKTFSQYWWPIQKIGPVQEANEDVALRFVAGEDRRIQIAMNVSRPREGMRMLVTEGDRPLLDTRLDLVPGELWEQTTLRMSGEDERALEVVLFDCSGIELVRYRPLGCERRERRREIAKEPAAPEEIDSVDSLFLVGEHLAQYRHPTRNPEAYWKEGLRRDPGDARCNLWLGKSALKVGEFDRANEYLQAAILRLTQYHPNPYTGEAHYYAGVCCRFQRQFEKAYELLYKAAWNFEWRAAAYYELACIDFSRRDFSQTLQHVRRAQETNTQNNKAVVLEALALAELGDREGAARVLENLLLHDPLEPWAVWELDRLRGGDGAAFASQHRNDAQIVLDIAFDYISVGAFQRAEDLLEWHLRTGVTPVATPHPLSRTQSAAFTLAWMKHLQKDSQAAREMIEKAGEQCADYFFPSRLEEQIVLEWVGSVSDAWLPRYGIGNYYYDKRRHQDAIRVWEEAASKEAPCATVHRNLGIAYWNCGRDGGRARAAYEAALRLDPDDARLVFEYDQLRKRLGDETGERLSYLESKRELVLTRDDASVEFAGLLNESGRYEETLELLTGRRFHPWEGGEGKVLEQFTRAKLGLGRRRFDANDYPGALVCFKEAFDTPENLGEVYHPLQAKAEVNYWIGLAQKKLGRAEEARTAFEACASELRDIGDAAVLPYSEDTYYHGLALVELGRRDEARELFTMMIERLKEESRREAKIDYFATSLPNLLVFEDNLREARDKWLAQLRGMAETGLGLLNT